MGFGGFRGTFPKEQTRVLNIKLHGNARDDCWKELIGNGKITYAVLGPLKTRHVPHHASLEWVCANYVQFHAIPSKLGNQRFSLAK